MHIFELLLRLRQLCDHNYLVLMCLTREAEDRKKGSYAKPQAMIQRMLEGIRAGDMQVTNVIVSKLFAASRICPICQDDYDNPYVTPCGHQFCKQVNI